MARRKLTPEETAAKVAKAKATREANKRKALEAMGMQERPKTKSKRKRKPMTAEQKKAAAERLKKAREAKRAKQGDKPKYTQYDDTVVALPDEDTFSLKNVKQWLKTNKAYLKEIRSMKDSKSSQERLHYAEVEGFVQNLNTYMRTGIYLDHRAGENRQKAVQLRCVKMAYYADGTPKRTVGVYYPDLGKVYAGEQDAA